MHVKTAYKQIPFYWRSNILIRNSHLKTIMEVRDAEFFNINQLIRRKKGFGFTKKL